MKILQIGYLGENKLKMLHNVEDVRRYIESYSGLMGCECIGDLSLLSLVAQSALLKFIEEGIQDIICYASRDNVSPVLASRFDRIDRKEEIEVGQDPFSSFVKKMRDAEEKPDNLNRAFVSISAFYLESYLLYRQMSVSERDKVGDLL